MVYIRIGKKWGKWMCRTVFFRVENGNICANICKIGGIQLKAFTRSWDVDIGERQKHFLSFPLCHSGEKRGWFYKTLLQWGYEKIVHNELGTFFKKAIAL